MHVHTVSGDQIIFEGNNGHLSLHDSWYYSGNFTKYASLGKKKMNCAASEMIALQTDAKPSHLLSQQEHFL